ncbi:MAG TPA: pitrilysin family protein, partial [Pyrinomonadaceae bacterium]|nr:pitrilysin family protein [Pyrinomonadaceae bacterium]
MRPLISKNSLRKPLLALLLVGFAQHAVPAQVPAEPDRSKLLNSLTVLMAPRPGDPQVLLKLRIHSGAAFDLSGKAGSMAALGDVLFPDPTTREYLTEEMQGQLNVKTDYDAITITLQGRAREFERIVEILRTALVTMQVTPENVAKAKEGRIKVIRETSISPAAIADRAIAVRLFGDFPYGRPYVGTVESLERVDRVDLMVARERFLNPNNATLVVIGGVQPNRAMRALRQLLGAWRKSEQLVPATFRQPVDPDPRTLVVNAPGDQSVEVRLAVRGLARKDPDATAAALLASVARQRWEKLLPVLSRSPVFVRHYGYSLPGMFVMGTTTENVLAGKALTTAQDVIKSLSSVPASAAELELARSEVLAQSGKELEKADGVAEAWLDIETYGLPPLSEQLRVASAVSAADLQRVASRLFRPGANASVIVGNAEAVKP